MAKSRIVRSIAALTAASLCMGAVAAREARAGQWVVDHYECVGGDWSTYGNLKLVPGLGAVYVTQSGNWAIDRSDRSEFYSGGPSIFGSSKGTAEASSQLFHDYGSITMPLAPGSRARTTTSVRAVLRWVPDTTKPSDPPPRYVYYRQQAWTRTKFRVGDWWQNIPPTSVGINMHHGVGLGASYVGGHDGVGTGKVLYGTDIKRVVVPRNTFLLPLPVNTQVASVIASDAEERNGSVSVTRAYEVGPFHVYAKRPQPSPEGDPVLKGNSDNEFVLHGYSEPLEIRAAMGVNGSIDSSLLDEIASKSRWDLTNPPKTRLTPIMNGNRLLDSTSGEVFPQTRSDVFSETDPDPLGRKIEGIAISGRGPLPAGNDAFGGKDREIKHIYDDVVVGRSPIEIFYSAGSKEHPPSNALMYCDDPTEGPHNLSEGSSPKIPNWYYYYSQSWPRQWGVRNTYTPGGLSGVNVDYTTKFDPDIPGGIRYVLESVGDHAHIADNAYGERPTQLFAHVNGSSDLKYVGDEYVKGLDNFARLTTHEAAHQRIATAIYWEAQDTDNDLVPDDVETAAGLNPRRRKSVTNWTPPSDDPGFASACPDSEVIARICEQGILSDATQDWADGGLNRGTPSTLYPAPPGETAPPNILKRTREVWKPEFANANKAFTGANARAAIQ